MNKLRPLALGGLLLASACRGEEVARVQLDGPGDSGEADWKGGAVKVWADYKGEWEGSKDPKLKYSVEVKDGKTVVADAECSTSTCSSSVCGNTVTINNSVKANCECLMSCKLDVPAGKDYTVSAKVSGGNGSFENASLVLRK
jgi:hypothetical protein